MLSKMKSPVGGDTSISFEIAKVGNFAKLEIACVYEL